MAVFYSPPASLPFPDQATESSRCPQQPPPLVSWCFFSLHSIALHFHSDPEKLLNTSPDTSPWPLRATRCLRILSYADLPSKTQHKSTLVIVFQDDYLSITMIGHHDQGSYRRKGLCGLLLQSNKSSSLSWLGSKAVGRHGDWSSKLRA